MLFNSFRFLVFYPIVVLLFFSVPHRWRWILLLVASYVFYMGWRPEYLALIVLVTLTSYFAALLMDSAKTARMRGIALFANLLICGGVLFLFKYLLFSIRTTNHVLSSIGTESSIAEWSMILPVGVSFYTFQTLSYSLDVYFGKRKHDTHLGIFSLYVAFFPQLVAGPIERSTSLMPQFYEEMQFDYDRAVSGMRRILWGMFKKVVVADNLAVFVSAAYDNVGASSGGQLLTATVFFSIQIYCDFSGYSDIAIGAARVMGFRLMKNFDAPYFSSSVAEFWRRWHISLSTWFRDYLYFPLGGSRHGRLKTYRNYLIVFLVSGLWHGAEWTFVVWGGIHGAFLVVEDLLRRFFARPQRRCVQAVLSQGALLTPPRVLLTFSLVTLSWVFFRAGNISEAMTIFGKIGGFLSEVPNIVLTLDHKEIAKAVFIGQRRVQLLICCYGIAVLLLGDALMKSGRFCCFFLTCSHYVRLGFYFIITMSVILLGNYSSESPFIYFQF